MCGISAAVGNINSTTIATDILTHQLGRGTDATGIAWVNDGNKLTLLKEAKSPIVVAETWKKRLADAVSYMCIAHNRSASCNLDQKNLDTEAHPFISEDGTFALLHNGSVPGYGIYIPYMKTIGHKFTTGIDSELFMHILEDILVKIPNREMAMKEFYKIYVGNVLVLFNDGDLWGYSGNSSFIMIASNKGTFIGSDVHAINKSIHPLNVSDKTEIYYPDSPAYVNIKLTKNKHHNIKFYGKWVKYAYKADNWVFSKVTFCDFCHTSGVPTERFDNKDRCFKCYTKKITEPMPYVNCGRAIMGYGFEGGDEDFELQVERTSRGTQMSLANPPTAARTETEIVYNIDKDRNNKPQIKTVGICSHCHLPHLDKDIIICGSCHRFFCKRCFANHICNEKYIPVNDHIGWLKTVVNRKYMGEV
jgi:predicted glutamine amidotransferase